MIREETTTRLESEAVRPVAVEPAPSPRSRRFSGPLFSVFRRWQIARYLAVGVWNTLFGYACYAGFVALYSRLLPARSVPLLVDLASVTATPISVTSAFLCYKFLVFHTRGSYLKEWLRCLAVYGSAAIPGLFVLPVLTRALQHAASLRTAAPYLAGLLMTGFTTVYSYLAHRNFTFSAPKVAGTEP